MSILNFCLESFGSEHSCHNREKYIEEHARKHSTSKKSVFIIYLLEDEQELSLGMLIRLQPIYNFLLFHVIIYPSRMFYMHLYAILLSVLDVNGLYFTLLYYFWD